MKVVSEEESHPFAQYAKGWGTRGQLFTLMVTGSASLKVSGVSGRSLMSFFPVSTATVVPAAAPTGPPMSAPSPPSATAPITAPPPAPPPIHAQLRFLCLPPLL